MKTLTFGASDQELFVDLYSMFGVGERFLQGVKGIRSAGRVYDALDGISQVDGQLRSLQEGGRTLELETEDYETLRGAVTRTLEQALNVLTAATQIHYRALDARRAGRLLTFLDEAKEVAVRSA